MPWHKAPRWRDDGSLNLGEVEARSDEGEGRPPGHATFSWRRMRTVRRAPHPPLRGNLSREAGEVFLLIRHT